MDQDKRVGSGAGSVIGKKMTILGQISCKGELAVAGTIEGTLDAGDVSLLSTGKFRGNLHCQSLLCGGRLEGEVAVAGKGVFLTTARQYGQLRAKTLELEQGVRYDCLEPLADL